MLIPLALKFFSWQQVWHTGAHSRCCGNPCPKPVVSSQQCKVLQFYCYLRLPAFMNSFHVAGTSTLGNLTFIKKKPHNNKLGNTNYWPLDFVLFITQSFFFFFPSCILLIWRSWVSQFLSEDCIWQSLSATEYFNAFILARPFIQKGSTSLKLIKLNSTLRVFTHMLFKDGFFFCNFDYWDALRPTKLFV